MSQAASTGHRLRVQEDNHLFVWIVVLGFVLVTGLAAGRLLMLWRETRCLPELLIAILILGVGTVAVGGGFLIIQLVPPGPARTIADFIPISAAAVGMIALAIFTWRVYRPESRVARAATATIGLGLAGLIAIALHAGSVMALSRTPYLEIQSAIHVSVMLWSASEAILYWSSMKRRLALGLADPMVVNRILLWGIATGMAGLGIAIGAGGRIFGADVSGQASWIQLNYALHGTVSAFAFWFAFKPPQAYARWVRGASESSTQ
jgi:hypothetical protein